MHFEEIIEAGCDYYRSTGRADIEKTPEPMKPIQQLGNGRFVAVYTKAAQTDFKGTLAGGRSIVFEAKHTDTGEMAASRVEEHQAERLERAYKLGAVAFVLCSFGPLDIFRVPWSLWRTMKEKFGHKYITPREAEPFRVRYNGVGALQFLENMEEGGSNGK